MSYPIEAMVDDVETEVSTPANGADQLDVSDPRIRELLDANRVVRKIVKENGLLFEQFHSQVDPKKLDEAKYRSALHIIEAMGLDSLIEEIYNKRGFNTQLKIEVGRALRNNLPLIVLLLDLDDFKKVNTNYGLLEADQTLVRIGQEIKQHTRMVDTVARWGGDEFGIILQDTTAVEVVAVAMRLLRAIPSLAPEYSELTASIGIAQFDAPGDKDGQALFSRAESALRAAKEFGKDQIVIAGTANQDLSIESLDAGIQNKVTLIHK